MQIQKPRFGGAFFYVDADALYAFKSRGFGGEIGVGAPNSLLLRSQDSAGTPLRTVLRLKHLRLESIRRSKVAAPK